LTQLTELRIEQYSGYLSMRPELAGLSRLRKLTLGPAGQRGEHVADLLQLSQLRELTLLDFQKGRLRIRGQAPPSLQLESLTLAMTLDYKPMCAVVHLPTLTALDPAFIDSTAWPLLPQLPRLRRLSIRPSDSLTPKGLASLCEALSHCLVLEELTLQYVYFVARNGSELSAELEQAGWAELLGSVPGARRLCVGGNVDSLVPVLPLHLPLLEHLELSSRSHLHLDASVHPNLRPRGI
jgi:hypothetical protein